MSYRKYWLICTKVKVIPSRVTCRKNLLIISDAGSDDVEVHARKKNDYKRWGMSSTYWKSTGSSGAQHSCMKHTHIHFNLSYSLPTDYDRWYIDVCSDAVSDYSITYPGFFHQPFITPSHPQLPYNHLLHIYAIYLRFG